MHDKKERGDRIPRSVALELSNIENPKNPKGVFCKYVQERALPNSPLWRCLSWRSAQKTKIFETASQTSLNTYPPALNIDISKMAKKDFLYSVTEPPSEVSSLSVCLGLHQSPENVLFFASHVGHQGKGKDF